MWVSTLCVKCICIASAVVRRCESDKGQLDDRELISLQLDSDI
jgi:hypothetical protein